MELIVINQSKLKIMLTVPDMQRYELAPGHLDCADAKTRRSFRRIFDDVRMQTGFDTAGERLLVQLYTSRSGGCEIFVTKLGMREKEEDPPTLTGPEQALLRRVFSAEVPIEETDASLCPDADLPVGGTYAGKFCEGKKKNGQKNRTQPVRPILTRSCAILFVNLPSLLSACRRLMDLPYADRSSAYILNEARELPASYCLLLHVPDSTFFKLPAAYGFLLEYGTETNASIMDSYLGEHGRLLCAENAVETLGALA
jgi:negative regulator of genetic competence, sporulation and motility